MTALKTRTSRRDVRGQGVAWASTSTLGRLENAKTADFAHRRELKGRPDQDALTRLFVERFLEAHEEEPESILSDFDATVVPPSPPAQSSGSGLARPPRCCARSWRRRTPSEPLRAKGGPCDPLRRLVERNE